MTTKSKYIIEGENRTDQLFNELVRDVKKVDKSMRGISQLGFAVGGAVTAAFGGAQLIGKLREFDVLEASLQTVTGSAEGAEEALAWIEPFAAKTPFQLEEVIGAFVKLTALGLEPSEAALVSYGNTASAMGKSLDQFIEAVADASTGEFERLKEFGIKSSVQGDQVAFTFRGVKTTVEKESKEIVQYLQSIGDVDFAGAMERRANSLDGALSNLEDSFASLARAIGDAGVSEVIKGLAGDMSTLTASMADALENEDGILRLLKGIATGLTDIYRGSDQQRLGELEAKIIGLEEKKREFESRIVEGGSGRNLAGLKRQLDTIIADLEKAKAEAEGLKAVLKPEEFGAAPRTETDKPKVERDLSGVGDGSDELTKAELAREETRARKIAKLLRDQAREREKFASETVAFEEQLANDLRENQTGRLRDLEQSLLTEREAVERERAERLQLIRVAEAQELDTIRSFSELRERVEADAAEQLAAIQKRELDELAKSGEDAYERLTRAAQGWGDEATDALVDFAITGKATFGDFAESVLKDLARIAARKAITDPLTNFFGDVLSGVFSTAPAAQASRAGGGPVVAGIPTKVNEVGEEIFIPSTSGTVTPISGLGTNVNINVINNGNQNVDVRKGAIVDGEQQIDIVIGEVVGRAIAGGEFDRALNTSFGLRRRGTSR